MTRQFLPTARCPKTVCPLRTFNRHVGMLLFLHCLREGLATGLTVESSFLNLEKNDLISKRGIFHDDQSTVIDAATQGGTPWAQSGLSGGPDPVMYPGSFPREDIDHFQFRKQQLMG